MKNSKEKAIELYHKYADEFNFDDTYRSYKEQAKQCALIAVDEISALDYLDSVFLPFSSQTLKEYWQQVKTEINNL